MTRGTRTATALVLSLAAISAGTWGLSEWRPFDDNASEIDWPQNVQPLIDYIEDATDLEFRESIDFEYIADNNTYNERAGDKVDDVSGEQRAAIAIDEAVGRSLGLWTGDTSLLDSFTTIGDAKPRPARWLAEENLMLVHARDEKAALRAVVRADLVVYLTQAVVEQNFHLIEQREASDTPQEYDANAALHIGIALWVHDQYVEDLDASDRDRYETETAAQGENYVASVDSVPATFKAIRIAFQVLGPVFVTALAEDDPALIIEALRSHVPVALDQVSLPAAKYLREDAPESVTAPPAPAEATVHYSDQLGPFRLFLMFASGLPANEALTASDGWGNDRFTVYEIDGRVCADVHVVADSPADADRMEWALNHWALARPGEADALVGREGVNVYASVCDPGTDAEQSIADENDIEQFFSRADMLRYQAVVTGKPALAECIAVEFFAQFTYEQLSSTTMDRELDAAFTAIEEECRNSV